jgi:hypothetical protein
MRGENGGEKGGESDNDYDDEEDKGEYNRNNDDLLYDENMDDDEKFLQRKCGNKALKSDARLSCPQCFSSLSFYTQKHEKYYHQYRAVFVHNCIIERGREMVYDKNGIDGLREVSREEVDIYKKKKEEEERGKENKLKIENDRNEDEGEEEKEQETYYNLVSCGTCGERVGIVDKKNIFIFFNVFSLPSKR